MHTICNYIKFKFLGLYLVYYYTTIINSTVQSQLDQNVRKLKTDTNFNSQQLVGNFSRFRYTGSIQSVSVPAEVNSISVHLWGGGGYGAGTALGGSGAYMKGTISVSPGSTIDVFVAGGGSLGDNISSALVENTGGSRCGRRLGAARHNIFSDNCNGNGGRSLIQISRKDILIAEGGHGRASFPLSPLQSSMDSSSISGGEGKGKEDGEEDRSNSSRGTCNGQHSKYFDPTACGRGGGSSESGQNGLVVIELIYPSTLLSEAPIKVTNSLPALPSMEPTHYLADPSSGVSSIRSSQPSSRPTAPTAQPVDSPSSMNSPLLILITPLALFGVTVFTCLCLCFFSYYCRGSSSAQIYPAAAAALVTSSADYCPTDSSDQPRSHQEEEVVYAVVTLPEHEDDLNFCLADSAIIANASLDPDALEVEWTKTDWINTSDNDETVIAIIDRPLFIKIFLIKISIVFFINLVLGFYAHRFG